jgi:hypothetical protein
VQSARYYRQQAQRARRLRTSVTSTSDVAATLERLAEDMDDIATDLENGAINIVHPERMPQLDHPR